MAVKIAACRFDGRLREAPVLDDADLLPPAAKKERLLPTDETLRLRHHHFAEPVAVTDCLERIVSAKGQYMYSDKGIQYLDMRNNVHHVGHCHPKVVEAGVKQMTLLNTNSRFLHDEIVKLARNLSSTLPGKLDCFFFTNSGSEANDLALQITEQVTGHSDMIAINGAYHGHLKSLRAISNHPMSNIKGQRKPDYAHIVSLPDIYRGQYTDPVTAGELYADEVKHIIEECHQQGKKIAAFICETILCCGGVVVLPDGYLKHVYDSIHSAGGLCIADEVQTGFGRVGSHFWAFELQGVIPDIVTMGKPMGNGHPVAAVVTTREIADKFAATGIEYFNTFGGNPVSMAIACSVLEVIKEEKLQENALTVGTYLLKQLRQLQSGHDCIGDVRGVGLMIGVEIVKSKATREPDKDKAKAIITRLTKEYQILGLYDGVDGNVLKIKPPACVTVENMDYFVCSLDAILSTM